jgi:Putative beta-barrel porin-2, OmpL-like. bbp2
MRTFFGRATLFAIAAFCILSVPAFAADGAPDDSKNTDSTAKASTKPDAPKLAPVLTEREQWMLDRIEQLEKRVAELESKGSSTAATNPSTTNPSVPAPATSASIASPSASSGPAIPVPVEPTSSSSVNVKQEQTTPATPGAANGKPAVAEPFSFADWTWLNGNPRTKEAAFDSKFFTPEIRTDAAYIYDFNHPKDDTIGGSAEVFRAQEFQLTLLGVGGDFHYDNVRARLMTQFGMYSQTQPRNDASPSRGQWGLDGAYRYLAEAYGGYHFNALHGINVDAGIFMSYIGLFSWYNFDNWAYQPSYVSSNTPFFFNGLRTQVFPTEKLKIEGWFINGWQSYGRFNSRPGLGFQILWRPTPWLSVVSNGYGIGADTLNTPGRIRYHSDNSVQLKYYDKPGNFLDKMAFSLTGDIGCEHGGGVSCAGGSAKGPKQSFIGYMAYNRFWFDRDRYAITLGGGQINNPGRYLVLIPPINGATASTGTPYFTANPGDPFKAWDASATFDWMPSQYITFRWEFDHRAANVPYFTGAGGITPPGGNNGAPGALVCLAGFTTCDGSVANTWYPDLRKTENRLDLGILVKF